MAEKEADIGGAALQCHVHRIEIVETLGEALVDGVMRRTLHGDHVAERAERFTRQWFGPEKPHQTILQEIVPSTP